MLQSKLFTKTLREAPKDEVSKNAELLTRGGFIYKNSAGIYTYLPLGWKVLENIIAIIREEMNKIGGQELFMPALVEKKYMQTTGRWGIDIAYEVKGKNDKEANFTLGWTHEEIITAIATQFIQSYKDLPLAVYQIQTKFRNEPRAKSGILRGREFMMKDLYSFHINENDFLNYYDSVKKAYMNVFERCGLKAFYTVAGGGAFTSNITHEFQIIADAGEDNIYICEKCGYAENEEVSKFAESGKCPNCGSPIHKRKSIEVGNIFPLGTKYSEAFGLMFADEKGVRRPVVMGSYGIGLGRLMGTIAEIYHDEKGLIWPEAVAPFKYHIVPLTAVSQAEHNKILQAAEKLCKKLEAKNGKSSSTTVGLGEVLFDDRYNLSVGERLADADLIGIPNRIIVSQKTLAKKSYELTNRGTRQSEFIKL